MYQIFVVMMFEKVQLTKTIISRVNLPALAIGFRLATLFSQNDAGKGSGYARLTQCCWILSGRSHAGRSNLDY